jgi:hypothetical protein
VAGAWYHLNVFHISALPRPWLLWAAGSAGYLLALVGFGIWGDRHQPAAIHARIATALALGAALCFATYAWNEYSFAKSGPTGGGTPTSDPLSPVNALAAVLAIVLAVVTLIAQKSASDAKTEAEKARNDILDAMNVRLLASASRLLERAQSARTEAEEIFQEANEVAEQDPETGRYLSLAAASLRQLAKFLVTAHGRVLDAEAANSDDLTGQASLLRWELRALGKALRPMGSPVSDMEQRLRAEFWQPSARLIRTLLNSLGNIRGQSTAEEAEKEFVALRDIGKMLNEI